MQAAIVDALAFSLTLALVVSLVVGVAAAALDGWRADRKAIARAAALLRAHLSERELDRLERSGVLYVPSPSHVGRVYLVRATSGHVTVLKHGAPELELCIRPRELLPGREHVLAHKLMIEAAEDEYTRRANVVWRAGQATLLDGRVLWD
ncbi:MAG: hypothetical protein JO057_20300 [Chloroflexi bacterium]|nr:hypothetical protein [Chloroflexota bacterium]